MSELVTVQAVELAKLRDQNAAILDKLAALESKIDTLTRTEPDYYSITEFARLTGWSHWTVRQWCKEGRLKARYEPKKRERWEIDPRELKRVGRKRS
jgi:hypothetical protein